MEPDLASNSIVQVSATDCVETAPARPAYQRGLVPFAKGHDPRRGHGKPRPLSKRLEKQLRAKVGEDGERMADRFVASILQRAMTTSDALAKEVWNRVEGPLESESGSSVPVAIQIVIETVGGEK